MRRTWSSLSLASVAGTVLVLSLAAHGGLHTAAPPYPARSFAGAPSYEVVGVVDGDTVKISMNGVETSIRLIGVDTPETVHPQTAVEAFGQEACSFTCNLLRGERVYIEYESGAPGLDKYDRTLGYLYRAPDGLFVNLEIIRQGYGHAYLKYPFQHAELFKSYETRAREAGKGLWKDDPTSSSGPPALPSRAAQAPHPLVDTPAPAAKEKAVTVYITKSGSKYHRAGCRHLSKSMIPISLEEAKADHSPCSVCGPP